MLFCSGWLCVTAILRHYFNENFAFLAENNVWFWLSVEEFSVYKVICIGWFILAVYFLSQ